MTRFIADLKSIPIRLNGTCEQDSVACVALPAIYDKRLDRRSQPVGHLR
jgi:hypothetical protein